LKILFFKLVLIILVIPLIILALPAPRQGLKPQRGYNFDALNQNSKRQEVNKSKINDQKNIQPQTVTPSLTFENLRRKDNYFPQEKDKPSLLFKMTWAF
jgi:hypothetical protein